MGVDDCGARGRLRGGAAGPGCTSSALPARARRRSARRSRPRSGCRTTTPTPSTGCPPIRLRTPRPLAERLALFAEKLPPTGSWVLSGSAISWAEPLEPLFGLIVYLRLDPAIRMEKLRKREQARYGGRVAPGGDMAASSADFLRWAAAYDTAGPEQRSRATHERWLASQAAPVLRLDSSRPVADLVAAVLSAIGSAGGATASRAT